MAVGIDQFANTDTLLGRWDPRFKLLSLGLLIFCIALVQTIPIAMMAFVMAMVLLMIARVNLHTLHHALIGLSVFLLPFLLILPLTYPGEHSWHLFSLPFSWAGFRLAVLIVLKALAIVCCSYALFGSLRFDVAMTALHHLKCPTMLVQIFVFTYRYIFVFLNEMNSMRRAMGARGFVPKTDLYTLKAIGNFIATLLVKSFERTDKVYKAMLSKGYSGEFHTLTTFKSCQKDYVKAGIIISAAVMIIAVDVVAVFPEAQQGWY